MVGHKGEGIQIVIVACKYVYNCSFHQFLIIIINWVLPREHDLFTLFLEVITSDCTEDTNNDYRTLLTMGGKDSLGKVFFFCLYSYQTKEGGGFDRYLTLCYTNCFLLRF